MDEKKIKWMIGIIFISLVVFGGAMILFQKQRYSKYYFDFNGFLVHRVPKTSGDVYSIQIFLNNNPQPYIVNSRYDPRELDKLDVEENIEGKILDKKELFITMDSEASSVSVLAATEISKITGNAYMFNIPTHGALDAPVEGKNITVKTCNDITGDIGIIYLKESDKERIYSEGECVIVEGNNEGELVKVANRLMLDILGVF